jgi:transcriptional regulator with XRE-family HTH domain
MGTRTGDTGAVADLVEDLFKNRLELTTAEFADLANVSTRTVQNWLNGKVVPRDDTLADLVDRIRRPPDDISRKLRDKVASRARSLDLDRQVRAIRVACDEQREATRSHGRQIAATQVRLKRDEVSLRQLLFEQAPSHLRLQPMTTVFTQDLESRVRFEERLLEDLKAALHDTTRQPLLSSLVGPTFVTRPWEYQSSRQTQMYDAVYRKQVEPLLRARYDAWYELARAIPIRWLLDKRGHEEYFLAALRSGVLTAQQFQAQLTEMLRIIEEYEGHLEVALQLERIPTTYSVFGIASATIYGHINSPDNESAFHGIRSVITQEPLAVYAFHQSFDRDWARCFDGNSRSAVRNWLRSLAAGLS